MVRHDKGTKVCFAGSPPKPDIRTLTIMSGEAAFDPDAWQAMLTEQRILIAEAAGVHPSKVSIRLGH